MILDEDVRARLDRVRLLEAAAEVAAERARRMLRQRHMLGNKLYPSRFVGLVRRSSSGEQLTRAEWEELRGDADMYGVRL